MPKPAPVEIKKGAPEWVVTFGDMMSLLLTFFVLILSFSSLEIENFKKLAGIMKDGFGVKSRVAPTTVPLGSKTLGDNTSKQYGSSNSLVMLQQARDALEKSGMEKRGQALKTDRGIVLRLDGDAVFRSGSAELNAAALPLLNRIAQLARSRSGQIEVEGHTDDVPIRNARYPSNWELSTARAGAAARYLIERGIAPTGVKAVGYADTRPVAANDTAENRARNRRVEFLFVTPTGAGREREERKR